MDKKIPEAASPAFGPGPSNEVRVVDAATGGEKGAKLARWSLIPFDFLTALAEHYGKGARKYADRNWERGYKWSLTVDAMMRHLAAWLDGEDNDPETGSSHLIAVAWHVVALWWFHRHMKGTDDVRRNRPAQISEGTSPMVSSDMEVKQIIERLRHEANSLRRSEVFKDQTEGFYNATRDRERY